MIWARAIALAPRAAGWLMGPSLPRYGTSSNGKREQCSCFTAILCAMLSFVSSDRIEGSDRHVVLGAGPVGRGVAHLLASRGTRVTLVSRSGAGPAMPGVERVAVDVTDAAAVGSLAAGASTLYNCLNPPHYHRWPIEWPPMAAAALSAAEHSGAVLVTASNLYAYGPSAEPYREGDPDRAQDAKGGVRATMWAQALAAHREGRLRAVEARASDYVGPAVGSGGALTRAVPQLRDGKRVQVIGDPDQPHTWTDVRDMARTLVALAERPQTWGQVWHVPSHPPVTQREFLIRVAEALGVPSPKLAPLTGLPLHLLGVVIPTLRAIREMAYQFTEPFVMDSTRSAEALDLEPTPWPEVLRSTAEDN